MKNCCTCKIEKPLDQFGKHKGKEDGYRSQCKDCRNIKLRTGRISSTRFQKGHVPWIKGKKGIFKGYWTGKKLPKEVVEKIRKASISRGKSRECFNAKEFRKKVIERDQGKCQKCGTDQNIHVHHMKSWAKHPELRFDVDNGMCLCRKCHGKEDGYKKGHAVSEFNIQKTKEKNTGRPSWNKGKHWSEEMKKKLSEAHKKVKA